MKHQLRVFTHKGEPLDELDAAVHVQWGLNVAGKAEFSMSLLDEKCREPNVRYGAYLLFTHPDLPSWGGYFWTPLRSWPPGAGTFGAVGAEKILERRKAPASGTWSGSAQSIFRTVLAHGNAAGNMLIVPESITGESESMVIELREQSLADVMAEVQENSAQDWWLEPELDSEGNLVFKAQWRPRRGQQKDSYALIEGKNFEMQGNPVEEGGLYNQVTVVGEGATEENKERAVRQHQRSRQTYGLTEYVETMSVDAKASLAMRAEEILEQEAFPRWRMSGIVYERMQADGTLDDAFKHVRVGDVMPLQVRSVGFFNKSGGIGHDAQVRVIAMEYKTDENQLHVTLEQASEGDVYD